MDYNKKDADTARKYAKLSGIIGCDIVEKVKQVKRDVGIPETIKEAGIDEDTYKNDKEFLIESAMLGPTGVNPVKVSKEDMGKILDCIYYGIQVDF